MQINFPPPSFQFLPPNAEGLKSLYLGPKGPFMWPKATKNEACVVGQFLAYINMYKYIKIN